jgi:hypothetical protein
MQMIRIHYLDGSKQGDWELDHTIEGDVDVGVHSCKATLSNLSHLEFPELLNFLIGLRTEAPQDEM